VSLLFGFALLFTSMVFSSAALGKGVYQTVPEFLTEVFSPEEPVWVMEEIGKELPITIGVVVNQDSTKQSSIEQVKILAFRESRGWEVRYPAFTAQYLDVKMTPEKKLDTHIDGITGATLSVRAVTKVATLALFYHQQVMSAQEKPSQSKLPQNKETSPLVKETP